MPDLRTRIGLASAVVADRVPQAEKVVDLVLTASYGILGRAAEAFDSSDVTRAVELLDALGCAHLIRRRFASLSEGERKRVQIARALMADPEFAAARRARRRARPRWPPRTCCAGSPRWRATRGTDAGHGHPPRRGGAGRLHPRDACSAAAGCWPPVRSSGVFTERNLSRCFGIPAAHHTRQGGRWSGHRCRPGLTPLRGHAGASPTIMIMRGPRWA